MRRTAIALAIIATVGCGDGAMTAEEYAEKYGGEGLEGQYQMVLETTDCSSLLTFYEEYRWQYEEHDANVWLGLATAADDRMTALDCYGKGEEE